MKQNKCVYPTCERPGYRVELPTPCGRPPAVGGPYCDEHGGLERANAQAAQDWMLVAPPEVGDGEAVMAAGAAGLDTTHAYVVVRPEKSSWVALLGLGSHQIQVHHGRPSARQRGGRRHRRRFGRQGTAAFATREEALAEAVAQWKARVSARVEEVRAARGGTLDWGVPVEPLDEPVVVEVGEGENAWQAAYRLPRRGRPGLCMLSGLRPSGEAP